MASEMSLAYDVPAVMKPNESKPKRPRKSTTKRPASKAAKKVVKRASARKTTKTKATAKKTKKTIAKKAAKKTTTASGRHANREISSIKPTRPKGLGGATVAVIHRDRNKRHHWVIFARNGRPIAHSGEGYQALAQALRTLSDVTGAATADVLVAKDGQSYIPL